MCFCSTITDFLLKLQEKLGNGFERFVALDSLGKSSTGDLWEFTGIEGQSGKNMCHGGGKPDTGKFHSSYIIGMNVCGSAYENGCVVDGTCAMAAD